MRKNHTRKGSQKQSTNNNTSAKKTNAINTSNLSVMWTEKMGMVGTFQVYEKPDLREVASMLLDAAPSERGYITAHKTKSGYTFVMEGGYSVKIAKFADFAKLHRAEAEDFKRNAAKGLKQDPKLVRTVKSKRNTSNSTVITDKTTVVWYEYEDSPHTTYVFYESEADAEEEYKDFCKYYKAESFEGKNFKFAEAPHKRCCVGTFLVWKDRHPEDFKLFEKANGVEKHQISEAYSALKDKTTISMFGEVDGKFDFLCCWIEEEMTVNDAALDLAKWLEIPNYDKVKLPDDAVHTFESSSPKAPSYYVSTFQQFADHNPEGEELAKAYIVGQSHYVKNMTEDVPMFE